jgi:hypothetical protein
MAAKSLDFYQIYYNDSQKENLYPFAIPYRNERLTPYFENSVIADLVPKSNADYISVCSWRLKDKRVDRSMQLNGDVSLSYEKIVEKDFDVAILTPVSKSHQPLFMARQWHGEPWINAIEKLKEFIKVPTELSTTIYENHFIARKEVYHAYVVECLNPCINYISWHQCFLADAGYSKRKDHQAVQGFREVTKRDDWPIAPFILERLFSIWIHGKQLNVINL